MEMRQTIKKNGVELWRVADILGTNETALNRILRKELDQDTVNRYIEAIKEARKQRKAEYMLKVQEYENDFIS